MKVQYLSISYDLLVMTKVKVFEKYVKLQGQGYFTFKIRLKFLKSRSNFKVKVTRSKIMVWCERSFHKEYTCEIWKSYLLLFISYDYG